MADTLSLPNTNKHEIMTPPSRSTSSPSLLGLDKSVTTPPRVRAERLRNQTKPVPDRTFPLSYKDMFPHDHSDDHSPASLAEAREGMTSPEKLLKRLLLSANDDVDPLPSTADQKTVKETLSLSGNVISATFCVPQKIGYQPDGTWKIEPRRGTSALFDSFSYLTSAESEWRHTLVGWTGEIEREPEQETGPIHPTANGSTPWNPSATPMQHTGQQFRTARTDATSDLKISLEQKKSLESQLERSNNGRVASVWLSDEEHADGSITLRDQHKWRRYGEHELFTLFHSKFNEPNDGRASKKSFGDYVRMNEAFADAVLAVYSPGDLVIVHDYQLLLLPTLLRQRIPNIYLGFFLHIPFPSSEFYRCLSKRKEILNGVLGANMIGFQQFSYTRHFASCVGRILEYDATHASIEAFGRHIAMEVFPIGINVKNAEDAAFGPEGVKKAIEEVLGSPLYKDCQLIVGRDRLDTVRGVSQKLQAFEIFLERHPEWRGKVVLIQVTSPTSIDDPDEKSSTTETKIMKLVARINGTFGTMSYLPVHYISHFLSKDMYLALLRVADLGLITSVRDGMNTAALEYILCQRDKHSPLIISEFSGTAGTLGDAIHINPWDFGGVAHAIDQALTMDAAEKARAHHKLYNHVRSSDIKTWTNKYIARLLTNIRLYKKPVATPLLDRARMLSQHHDSQHRLFMFDYDGTLTPIVKDPSAAIPSDRVIRTLKTLSKDPRNVVWIVSGRDQSFLEEYMGDIPALGLSAEHGSFVRKPDAAEWENMTGNMDLSWHAKVLEIFDRFTKHPEGSFNGTHIEKKRIALTWHYRRTDPEWSEIASHECLKQLQTEVEPFYAVDVMKGKKNLEVRPRFVNKGEIAKRLVREHTHTPDFVLCMGDDHTDEGELATSPHCTLPPAD